MRYVVVIGALVALVGVVPAQAQTVTCTTSYSTTTCEMPPPLPASGDACAQWTYLINSMVHGGTVPSDELIGVMFAACGLSTSSPAAPTEPAASAPATGMTVHADGGLLYLPEGTFVKADDGPTIYLVAGGSLHAIPTWRSYLGHGGKADLSNVERFDHVRDEWVGAPLIS